MTKKVRIENADTSTYIVIVQVWDKGQPDTLVEEIELSYPTAITPERLYITSTRYIIVKEKT
jgi:hypothetical protein